ncbi:VOC family protein [Anoxynatronum buryatiense]|uniref:Methylmalonyl-CoA epimerase n=1 Tax=Anoxynatronum buryatiense TaxID=489973 RepID=A0AA46AIT3_9CLOT|nr:VOC family protein [Anoxynatronum buryatiense]SMP53807.1 methylmalonyl-CoA epimerase [Anoxynatronum buryatiense]
MLTGLSHIGVAVDNIDDFVTQLAESFGVPVPEIANHPERRIKVAVMTIGGVTFEILEESNSEGMLARYVAQYGPGLHHIGFTSSQLDTDMEVMKERKITFLSQTPATGLRGKRIAFAAENNRSGIQFELSE